MSEHSTAHKKHHALVTPLPMQGHINPAIHLAIKLASNGLTVTFANTEVNHNKTISDTFTQARTSGLDIRYETISDGLPIDFDRLTNRNTFLTSLYDTLPRQVETLIQKSASSDFPITCLVMDTNLHWSAEMAKKFGLPYVSYWVMSALLFSDYYNAFGHGDSQNDFGRYASYLQDIFDKVSYADFILCNTAEELEQKTIQTLQLENRFYTIGPMIPEGFTKSKVSTGSDCNKWLDSKPIGSVLYISFGSLAHISKKELEEIAYGVMESKTNFIWALRPDIISSNDPNPLPDGFREATKGKGIVATWCSQIEVLNHKSVGGFLTHCGWNSVLEAIRSEVPLLCYPLDYDQFTNRDLVVKDWRVGIDLGGTNTNVCREDVAEKIIMLMSGDEGHGMKVQVKEISKTLNSAISPDGSSTENLTKFIEHLNNHH